MYASDFSNETIQYLAEQLQIYFEPIIVERGYDYYLKQYVSNICLSTHGTITADIQGVTTYKTEVDPKQVKNNICSCGQTNRCKHVAAVIFALYGLSGQQPALLLHQFRKSRKAAKKDKLLAQNNHPMTQEPAQVEVTNIKTTKKIAPPEEKGTYEQWMIYFRAVAKDFRENSTIYPTDAEMYFQVLKIKLEQPALEWDKATKNLFHVTSTLFLLENIEQECQEVQKKTSVSYYYVGTYTQSGQYNGMFARTARKYITILEQYLLYDERDSLQTEHATNFLSQLAEAVQSHAMANPYTTDPVSWFQVYRLLWWYLLDDPERTAIEKQRLMQLQAQEKAHEMVRFVNLFFIILKGDDEKAFDYLQSNRPYGVADLIWYLDRFVVMKEWFRLRKWLHFLQPMIKNAKRSDAASYFQFWGVLEEHEDIGSERKEVLLAALPISTPFYKQFLTEKGEFKLLADFMLSSKHTPQYLTADETIQIERQDVALLLPIYHQAIDRLIQEKKREGYRTAVKLLLKLRVYYEKLGQQETFHIYLQQLKDLFSRLRAFQEELRSSKL